MNFYDRIKKICSKYEKVAMFVDMDGTIVEYVLYLDGVINTNAKGLFVNSRPLKIVIDELEKISKIENLDLFILSMARSYIIVDEKKEWLRKYASFIKEENWIIINREAGDYNDETRSRIKAEKILEKLASGYEHAIFLDDDHQVLHGATKILKDKCDIFHVSSALIY